MPPDKCLVLAFVLLSLPFVATGQMQVRREMRISDYGNRPYDGKFVFTRIRYGSSGRGWGSSWSHDYPRADQHLPRIMADLTTLRADVDGSNVFDLDDPEVFNFPLIYISEPGFWTIADTEAENLRNYLMKGGFVIFDDFEAEQWHNFDAQMRRALPDHRPIRIEITHPIFHCFFEMREIYFPHPLVDVIPQYYAYFEDNDPSKRMIGIVNYNNDLAEYWEWSATGMFPVDTTSEAYKLGVNYIVYAMTH